MGDQPSPAFLPFRVGSRNSLSPWFSLFALCTPNTLGTLPTIAILTKRSFIGYHNIIIRAIVFIYKYLIIFLNAERMFE